MAEFVTGMTTSEIAPLPERCPGCAAKDRELAELKDRLRYRPEIDRYPANLAAKDRQIADLFHANEMLQKQQSDELAAKDQRIEELQHRLDAMQSDESVSEEIAGYRNLVADKDKTIQDQAAMLSICKLSLNTDLAGEILRLQAELAAKDRQIADLFHANEMLQKQQDDELAAKDEQSGKRLQWIAELRAEIAELRKWIEDGRAAEKRKDEEINRLKTRLQELSKGKDDEIRRLNQQKQDALDKLKDFRPTSEVVGALTMAH